MAGGHGFALTYGGAQSTSVLEPQKGVWTASASTAIADLNIAGIVTIDSVKSFATGTANGEAGSATAERAVELSGVRALGKNAVITTEGVKVLDQGSTLATRTAQDVVNQALAQTGTTIKLVPPPGATAASDGTKASADSGGIEIHTVIPAVPAGNEVKLVIGRSFIKMSAVQIPDFGSQDGFGSSSGGTQVGTTGPGASTPGGGLSIAAPPALSPPASLFSPPRQAGIPPAVATPQGGATSGGLPRHSALATREASSGACGVACPYAVFSLLAFLLPAAYMTRRTLLGG